MKKRILLTAILGLTLTNATRAQNNGADSQAKAPIEVARRTLAKQLHIDAASIETISSDPHTWPDSSLGCGKPGSAAAQVMTSGYAIVLKAPTGNYRVHATDRYAVVCGTDTALRNPRNVGLPIRNLNEKIEVARADLAKKLGAPLNQIRTTNFLPHTWPDSSMDCIVAGEQVTKQPTKGYRIALRYQGRIYTYHTDLDRVRACPPIEVD